MLVGLPEHLVLEEAYRTAYEAVSPETLESYTTEAEKFSLGWATSLSALNDIARPEAGQTPKALQIFIRSNVLPRSNDTTDSLGVVCSNTFFMWLAIHLPSFRAACRAPELRDVWRKALDAYNVKSPWEGYQHCTSSQSPFDILLGLHLYYRARLYAEKHQMDNATLPSMALHLLLEAVQCGAYDAALELVDMYAELLITEAKGNKQLRPYVIALESIVDVLPTVFGPLGHLLAGMVYFKIRTAFRDRRDTYSKASLPYSFFDASVKAYSEKALRNILVADRLRCSFTDNELQTGTLLAWSWLDSACGENVFFSSDDKKIPFSRHEALWQYLICLCIPPSCYHRTTYMQRFYLDNTGWILTPRSRQLTANYRDQFTAHGIAIFERCVANTDKHEQTLRKTPINQDTTPLVSLLAIPQGMTDVTQCLALQQGVTQTQAEEQAAMKRKKEHAQPSPSGSLRLTQAQA